MNIYVKSDCEWLYPDEDTLNTPQYNNSTIELNAFLGSAVGVQILLTNVSEALDIYVDSKLHTGEINILREVCVNYNTRDNVGEDRTWVYFDTPEMLPEFLTRKAPFKVYDAYKPFNNEKPCNGKIAFFVKFPIDRLQKPGDYDEFIIVSDGESSEIIKIRLHIYPVTLPEKATFNLTNWTSFYNMAHFHNVNMYSDEHFKIIEKYADSLSYIHQQYFSVTDSVVLKTKNADGYCFDFSLFKRIAEIHFKRGLEIIEFRSVSKRKSIFQEELDTLGIEGLVPDSKDGITVLNKFFNEFYGFLKENGWQNKIVFHICDEPDEPLSVANRRLEQYATIYKIIKKYFPNAKIIEAVKTTLFKDYIDILVPETDCYENKKKEFEIARASGKDIWAYVCCSPVGRYFQRFLDIPMLSGRILFWAINKHKMTGFLHWGYNCLEETQHPFNQTNQYHTYGGGCCLPSGDSHFVYPDGEVLYYSMRMEMCRRGCEDFELLKLLEEKNKQQYDKIMSLLPDGFSGKSNYSHFNDMQRQLLESLSF